MDARPNVVLVHGAWADGSCRSGVIERLQANGYHAAARTEIAKRTPEAT